MVLTEIEVEIKTIEVSIVTTKLKDILIEDDDLPEGKVYRQIELPLARPHLHVDCIMYSVSTNQFTAGYDYVDKNQVVWHAINCDTIRNAFFKMDTFTAPNKVTLLNKPYKEGNHA